MCNCIILHDTTKMWPTLGGVPRPAHTHTHTHKKGNKDEILTYDPGFTPQ